MIKNDCYRDFFLFSRAHLFCCAIITHFQLSTSITHCTSQQTKTISNICLLISQILKSKRLRKISPLLAKDERRKNGHWDYRR